MNSSYSLFLKFSKYIIKIKFKYNSNTTSAFLYWKNKIKEWYEYPFLLDTSRNYHSTLEFIPNSSFLITKNNKNNYYIEILRKVSNKRYQTFYYISHTQFHAIIYTLFKNIINEGFFLHSSSVYIPYLKKVDLFIGKSGSGKTTISEILNSTFPKFTDDITFIYKKNKIYFASPILFDWEHKKLTNQQKKILVNDYPINKIYYLYKHNNEIKIKKMQKKKLLSKQIIKLLLTSPLEHYNYKLQKQKLIIDFIKNNEDKFYELFFSKDRNQLINFFKLYYDK